MVGIIIVCPEIETGKEIKYKLLRSGYRVWGICTSGAQALEMADRMGSGIVISEYQLPDMVFSELREVLPSAFEMLLIAPAYRLVENTGSGIMSLRRPFEQQELLSAISLMVNSIENRKNNKKAGKDPVKRLPEEKKMLNEAKALLMSRNNMSEEEAHRYIQKYSMDNSTSLQETARRILSAVR